MFEDPFRAIRIMFSLLWRAPSCRLIWRSRGASCALPTFAFEAPARIEILPGNITFCALAHVAWQLYFWGERGLEAAQDTIF